MHILTGYTGSGVKVAVIDTGIDKNHPALAGKVIAEFDNTGEGVDTPGFHGTHVAGPRVPSGSAYRDLIPLKRLV